MSPHVSQPWHRALKGILHIRHFHIKVKPSYSAWVWTCSYSAWVWTRSLRFPAMFGISVCLQFRENSTVLLKSAVMVFVPGRCMAFLARLWQPHKEASHALCCQELLISLEECQSEGLRAAFPESLSHSALPQTTWFQSSTKCLQPVSPHSMCRELVRVNV